MGEGAVFAVRLFGELRLFNVDECSSFRDFVQLVGCLLKGFDVGSMRFVCQVGYLDEIVLEGESDFKNLIRLSSILTEKIISVDVRRQLHGCLSVESIGEPSCKKPSDSLNEYENCINDVSGDMVLGLGLGSSCGNIAGGVGLNTVDLVDGEVEPLLRLAPVSCFGVGTDMNNQLGRLGKEDNLISGVAVEELEEDISVVGGGAECDAGWSLAVANECEDVRTKRSSVDDVVVVGVGSVSSCGNIAGVEDHITVDVVDGEVEPLLSLASVSGFGGAVDINDHLGRSGKEDHLISGVVAEELEEDLSITGRVADCDRTRRTRKKKDKWKGDVDMTIPCYDINPIQKKKPLLSDNWGNLFKAGLDSVWLGGAVHFRTELIKYSTHMGFKFSYVRNDSRYVHVICREYGGGGCDWFIKTKKHIALTRFVIDKANFIHKCVGKITQNNGERMSPSLIGELVMENVKHKPETSGKDIMEMLQLDYGIEVPYWKAWRTADAARARIFGTFDESYNQLRWYCQALVDTNPGSIVFLETSACANHFERVFIALNACVLGFKKCRPMLFIDATFMKGRARGTLLIATAKDADNGLFPVAFAVVSAENTSNWEWFLRKLKDGVSHDQQISFMSDRNNGLLAALDKVFGKPINYFCIVHLVANLKLRFPKGWTSTHREKMVECFKACAYAPTVSIFEEKMKLFKLEGGRRAQVWIDDIPVEKWAVCYSPQWTRYGEMTSNAAESFNAWISKEREMPITYMIDLIRIGINKWHVERRKESSCWSGSIVPTKEFLWANMSNIGRTWFVVEASSGAYEVRSSPSVTVDLAKRFCSCMQWKITGFPCVHAVAVIKRVSDNVTDYVDPFFHASTYRASYAVDIHPIPETERYLRVNNVLPKVNISPPVLKRPPDRPRKERMTCYGKVKKIKPSTCELCGKVAGHDFWTCAGPKGKRKEKTAGVEDSAEKNQQL